MLPGPEALMDFSIVVTNAYRAAQGVCQSSTSHTCTMTGQTPLMVREGGAISAAAPWVQALVLQGTRARNLAAPVRGVHVRHDLREGAPCAPCAGGAGVFT